MKLGEEHMTRGEAITKIYALFNAPHNADINIVGLNKVLDDLCNSHPEQEEWPKKPDGHMAGGVHPPQRTWVGLTDEDDLDWEEGGSLKDLVKAIESKLKEKNDGREWQDLTDDEMLMIYGQNHEGKKYNLGRMVQQALKDKNT